jgi:hypothetical protein
VIFGAGWDCAAALLPFTAERAGMKYKIPENAEIIKDGQRLAEWFDQLDRAV